MENSIRNFFECVSAHPSMIKKNGVISNIFIGSDCAQEETARAIIQLCPKKLPYTFVYTNIEMSKPELVNNYIERCDLFIFMYNSSVRSDIGPHGPKFIQPLKRKMAEHWRKSVLLREYGEFFKEAFSEDIGVISVRNEKIIHTAKNAKKVAFHDGLGGELQGTLIENQSWKSLDGRNHYDLMPGEVATKVFDLSGKIRFGGTFLSTVPFAIKYGVIDPILDIEIEQSRIVSAKSINKKLEKDINLYLDRCEGNRVIEEFGIGTNMNVKLHGLNASFEERHAGVHLGLGGGEKTSHHLDLVFSSGILLFDDYIIFDGDFYI